MAIGEKPRHCLYGAGVALKNDGMANEVLMQKKRNGLVFHKK